MNVEIRHEGTDITASVISYQREQEICSGIATLRLIRVENGREFLTWEQVDLYEEGSKKGEFYVKSVAVTHEGEMQVELQDASLKLQEFFIDNQVSYPYVTAARYWVERFFNEAGVDYQFLTTESGAPVAPDAPFGFNSAYDLIVQMLQISNWYFFINANGTAIIGSLTPSTSNPDATFNDDEILSIGTNMNDKMLRNRAVVWGGADVLNGTWVFADISVRTRWDYDANDKRTIVLSNHYIQTYYDAYRLANQMLNEFSTIYPEKTVVVVGEADVSIGDYVFIQSEHFHGGGVVTTVSSAVSDAGFVTTLVLDQRCPRLFGFYSHYDDYVYIGTYLDGVWRKMFSGVTWENYSTGITDLGITDLSINNGVFGSTTNSGLAYYRYITGGSWINFAPQEAYFPLSSGVDIAPSGFVGSGIYATCCTVDKMNNNVYYGFTTNSGVMNSGYLISGGVTAGSGLSWIVTLASNGSFLRSDQIVIERMDLSLVTDLTIVDLDNNGAENVAVCIAHGITFLLPEPTGVLYGQGYYDKWVYSPNISENGVNINFYTADTNVYAIGGVKDTENDTYVTQTDAYATRNSPVIVYGDEKVAFLSIGNDLVERYMNELGSAIVSNVYEWTAGIAAFYDSYTWQHYLYKVDDSGTYIVGLMRTVDDGLYPRYFYFKSIEATKGGDFTELSSYSIDMGAGGNSYYIKGPLVFITAQEQHSDASTRGWYIHVAGYNFVTGEGCDKTTNDVFNGYPSEISGVWRQGEQKTFSLDVNDDVYGHYLIQFDRMTIDGGEFTPSTWNFEIYCATLDSRSMSVGFQVFEVGTYSDYKVNKSHMSGCNIEMTGFSTQKTNTRMKSVLGYHAWSSDWMWITDIDLPYFDCNILTYGADLLWSPVNPPAMSYPLASTNAYEYISAPSPFTDAYLVNTNELVYVEIPLQLPAEFFNPIYNWIFYGFFVDTDINDGTIYGMVGRSSGSTIRYLCGWDRIGRLVKRGPSGDRLTPLFAGNQFFLCGQTSSTFGTNLRYIRWDEPSVYDSSVFNTYTNYVIKQGTDRSEFTVIYESPSVLAVDISKNAPTVIYSPQEVSGLWQPMGFMGVSWTLSPYDFRTITSNFPIADARTFDIGTPSGFVVESGTVSLSGFRYIAFVNSGGMFYIDSTLYDPAITTIATISGMATASGVSSGVANPSGLHRLEITNYSVSTPYFFAANPSGFWQRNPGAAYFTDYSAGLPSSAITIIRVDDRV